MTTGRSREMTRLTLFFISSLHFMLKASFIDTCVKHGMLPCIIRRMAIGYIISE